ncbi:LysR family transcriptional regulator [Xanthobacter autotrophicus]|uniref:LysR family transcriptional regulator n=1 Tax=Xanthobacter TaxID=279 RepID=UPI0024AA06C3|nr:LysR family transcriptional regulator [Xanthobacter autotrophicus]MDI4664014.1 LysR family transcriptional regulator [Xanthobacter autotrophicus]
MDVRQLRYFVAVAQERNFTRAAERLNIAQPPLSRQIQGLEDELGVQLIDRSERPLKLTEAGRFFYEQALQMIGRMDQIRNTTRQLGRSGRSLFVVGCVASTLYGGMPDLTRRMRRLWPDMEIELKEMSSTQQVAALKEGRIDLGFGRVRVTDPAIERITLREERLVLALPLDHPKLAQKGPLPLSTLEDEMLVLYPSEPRPSFADEVLVLLGDRNVRPRAIREVRELQMALGLVAADDGVTIVPAAAQRLRSYDVAYRHFDDPKLVSPIIMSYRANDASGRIEAIKQLIREMYADRPDWLQLSENRLLPP